MVEEKVTRQAKIVFPDRHFYQMAIVKLIVIAGKRHNIRNIFSQLMQQFIQSKALSQFILCHTAKGNIFLQYRSKACPFAVSVTQNQ